MKKKDKKVQYILIALVALIWGAIAIQFYTYSDTNIQASNSRPSYLPNLKAQTPEQLNFNLSLNYDDPFFIKKKNNITSQKTVSQKKNIASRISKKINGRKNKVIPKIIYKGYSFNNNQITRVNISVNNKMMSIQQGETKEGVLLQTAYKDSILIRFQNEMYTIYRAKN